MYIIADQMKVIQNGLNPKKKYQDFDAFLREKHAEDYHGTDDDMPDAFDHWLSNKEADEIMELAEVWGTKNFSI